MPLTDAQVESLGRAVVAFLGADENDDVSARAFHSVDLMTTMVRSYTRGNGFLDAEGGGLVIADDLQAVIVTATARLATNPAQSESESESSPLLRSYAGGGLAVGGGAPPIPPVEGEMTIPATPGEAATLGAHSFAFSGGFHGFTEVEKAILHRYRVRNG